MAPSIPLVNTLVKPDTLSIDKNMKLYLLLEAMMGVDRLVLYEDLHTYLKWCLRIFALILNTGLIVVSIMYPLHEVVFKLILAFYLIQYYLHAVIPLLHNNDLRKFLVMLRKFDILHPDTFLRKSEWYDMKKFYGVVALLFIVFGYNIFSYMIPLYYKVTITIDELMLQTLPFQFLLVTESMLCTHLLKLLSERIDSIINSLEKLKENLKDNTISIMERNDLLNMNENHDVNIKRIKDSYKMIVEATNLVQNAIKWQITIMMVLQFLPTLIIWYFNVGIILVNYDNWLLIFVFSGCGELLNLYFQVKPCFISDQINAKVKNIKTSLTEHLCCINLDKKARKSTRTFLLYVEHHDLRFRLLRVADVSVSLLLEYVTLMFTYLIILLQFRKLIDKHLYN